MIEQNWKKILTSNKNLGCDFTEVLRGFNLIFWKGVWEGVGGGERAKTLLIVGEFKPVSIYLKLLHNGRGTL